MVNFDSYPAAGTCPQVLLPVFMSSMRRVHNRLHRRLVVMATDAAALQSCRKQHPYCLPWFQRTCGLAQLLLLLLLH